MLASTFSCVMLFMLLPLSLASSSGASCAVSFTMLSYTDEPSRRSRKSAEPDIYVIKYQFFCPKIQTHTLSHTHTTRTQTHTQTNTHTNSVPWRWTTMSHDATDRGAAMITASTRSVVKICPLPYARKHTHTHTHDNPKISHCQTPPPPPAPPAPRRLTHAYTTLNLN